MAQTPTNEALYGSDKDDTTFSSSTSELGGAVGTETPPDETPEEHQRRMHEMEEELLKVESEIAMLRQVLGSKVRHATELKRELGITPFQEFKHDFQQGLEHIKNSESYQRTNDTLHQLNEKISQTQAYQKTSSVVKTATEKTSSAINSMGQAVVKKMGDIKKSQTFKSFDEKVHTTYANVKAKVTGSRSSGEIDKAFRDAHGSDAEPLTPESAEDASKAQLP
uniref:Tumor protein D54 n=1 Tax=Arion vulgaris TaxID=1028688 RepID=A0A0B7AV97_9EUPU